MSSFTFHLPTKHLRRSTLLLLLAVSALNVFALASAEHGILATPTEDLGGAASDDHTQVLVIDDAGMPLAHRVMVGAFTYGGVWQGMEPVLELEAQLGQRLEVVHWFTNWRNDAYPEMVDAVAAAGRRPLISWQPHRVPVREIAAGHWDEYIREWAIDLAGTGVPVYLRPFPEMNGDWVPWNGEPDVFRAAWRRMVAIFDFEGADNVLWVFSPNVTDSPRTIANRMELYYPGDDVVDVLALDGYNWGTTRPWTTWRPFEEVFATGYDRITALGDQPVWFAEISSSTEGGDKAAWVEAMLSSPSFSRLEAIVWFDEHKEADWRMVADQDVAEAFRDGLRRAELAAQ